MIEVDQQNFFKRQLFFDLLLYSLRNHLKVEIFLYSMRRDFKVSRAIKDVE